MVVRQALFHARWVPPRDLDIQVRIAHVAVIGGVLFKVGGGGKPEPTEPKIRGGESLPVTFQELE